MIRDSSSSESYTVDIHSGVPFQESKKKEENRLSFKVLIIVHDEVAITTMNTHIIAIRLITVTTTTVATTITKIIIGDNILIPFTSLWNRVSLILFLTKLEVSQATISISIKLKIHSYCLGRKRFMSDSIFDSRVAILYSWVILSYNNIYRRSLSSMLLLIVLMVGFITS